jgi:hypothetical protein
MILITSTVEADIAAIPSALSGVFVSATQLLYEWTSYVVEVLCATTLRVGDKLFKPLKSGLFSVRFENQLGLSTFQPFLHEQPLATTVKAVIPYPGDTTLFYNQTRHPSQPLTIHNLLLSDLAGIGALPFRPDL